MYEKFWKPPPLNKIMFLVICQGAHLVYTSFESHVTCHRHPADFPPKFCKQNINNAWTWLCFLSHGEP